MSDGMITTTVRVSPEFHKLVQSDPRLRFTECLAIGIAVKAGELGLEGFDYRPVNLVRSMERMAKLIEEQARKLEEYGQVRN